MHGGFGGAPKFPPSALLEGLLRDYERTGDPARARRVERTTAAMARGGIYDQLGGGFARYAVDAGWVVPHFEKMLYDNALLLRGYAHWARRTGVTAGAQGHRGDRDVPDRRPQHGRDVRLRAGRRHRRPRGPHLRLDPRAAREVLGADDGAWAGAIFDVTAGHVRARHVGAAAAGRPGRCRSVRSGPHRLRAARSPRPSRPATTRSSPHGTAWRSSPSRRPARVGCSPIGGGRSAVRALLLDRTRRRSVAPRSLGSASVQRRVLEDYAWLASGLLTLHQATGGAEWLAQAQALLDTAIAHFADPAARAVGTTPPTTPSRWCGPPTRWTGRPLGCVGDHRGPADGRAFGARYRAPTVRQRPRRSRCRRRPRCWRVAAIGGHWFAVAEAVGRGPIQIAVATRGSDSRCCAAARTFAPGGAVVVGGAVNSSELLRRPLLGRRRRRRLCVPRPGLRPTP